MLDRAAQLSKFQYKILLHALTKFASVKWVVYSTCSIYSEENETVVGDVLKKVGGKWKTVDIGAMDFGFRGSYLTGCHFNEELNSLRICPTCGPKKYLCGFFVTLFERIEKWVNYTKY